MVEEVTLNGTSYVSSRRAAAETGYSQDYIGQLARDGQIQAQRMTGHWYIHLPSVLRHKQEADEYVPELPAQGLPASAASIVSFDGKEYVPTKQAAKDTGYTQDYITQLARAGKVPSRQVGRRWFISRRDLVEHKRHNDALLAAVQAQATGFTKPEAQPATMKPVVRATESLQYAEEAREAIPVLRKKELNVSAIEQPKGSHVTDLRQKNVSRIPEIQAQTPERDEKAEHDIPISRMPAREAATIRRSYVIEEAMQERAQRISTRGGFIRIVRNMAIFGAISVVLGIGAYVVIGPVHIDGVSGVASVLNAIFGGGETYTRPE